MPELRILSTTAMKTSLDALVPTFEQASGHTVSSQFGPSPRIAKRVADGEANDVAIVTGPAVDDLIKQGRLVPGSRSDVAQSAMALAVKKGAPQPDISTPEAFRKTMLAARSLGMSNPVGGGVSGGILIGIFEELGIAEQMKPKLVFGAGGPAGLVGFLVERDEVEIGIQQMPELKAVSGVDVVGPLPFGIRTVSVFSAGISTAAKDAAGARALIAFLTTPEAKAAIRAHGMETP